MSFSKSRRDFVRISAMGIGAAYISRGVAFSLPSEALSHCVDFTHGVASGDPLSDRVIIWTRALPQGKSKSVVSVAWEVASDDQFQNLLHRGVGTTNADKDFTIKVDVLGLNPGQIYYYRFLSQDQTSPVGRTKTLPVGTVEEVNFAVVSCANFPAGYFHVYNEISKLDHLDALVHLGDYIYEYDRAGYASEDAARLNREVLPEHELLTLEDYRTRYAQYRSDANLQAVHHKLPFIAIWDDHEVANDTWMHGAENHQENEGDFEIRKHAALQAYTEWLPIRMPDPANNESIYRSFEFGDLLALHMLDTRVIGREKQVNYNDYISGQEIDSENLLNTLENTYRSLLGEEQKNWLKNKISSTTTVWQVLGQQVLMGRMPVPGAAATLQIHIFDLYRVAELEFRERDGDTLTEEELTFLNANRHFLTWPDLPYNTDSWDGYTLEREEILQTIKDANANVVVLAGDTHNAWANEIRTAANARCCVEFATSSVSSPGLEYYLTISQDEIEQAEGQISGLIPGLKFTNISNRGYLVMNFNRQEVTANYNFIDTVKSEEYNIATTRNKVLKTRLGNPRILGA